MAPWTTCSKTSSAGSRPRPRPSTKLKRENNSLKAKVKKLGGDDPKGADKAAWRKEREVVQKRLTQLAGNLEELL